MYTLWNVSYTYMYMLSESIVLMSYPLPNLNPHPTTSFPRPSHPPEYNPGTHTGVCYDFFLSLDYSNKPQFKGGISNVKCSYNTFSK